jgi:hypothetical protein
MRNCLANRAESRNFPGKYLARGGVVDFALAVLFGASRARLYL